MRKEEEKKKRKTRLTSTLIIKFILGREKKSKI